jgi:hypothetical protein
VRFAPTALMTARMWISLKASEICIDVILPDVGHWLSITGPGWDLGARGDP